MSERTVIDIPPSDYTVHPADEPVSPNFVVVTPPPPRLGYNPQQTRVAQHTETVIEHPVVEPSPGSRDTQAATSGETAPHSARPEPAHEPESVRSDPSGPPPVIPPPPKGSNGGDAPPPPRTVPLAGEEDPDDCRRREKREKLFFAVKCLLGVAALILVGFLFLAFFGGKPSKEAQTVVNNAAQVQRYPDAPVPALKTIGELRAEEAAARAALAKMQRLPTRSYEKEWQMEEKIRSIHAQILTLEGEDSARGTSITRGSRGKGLRADIDWDGNGRLLLEAEDNDACRNRLATENALLKSELSRKTIPIIIEQTVPHGSRRLGIYH